MNLEKRFKQHANAHTKEQLLTHLNNIIKFGRKNIENFDSINNMYIQKAIKGELEKLTKYQIVELKFQLRRAIDKAQLSEDYESSVSYY